MLRIRKKEQVHIYGNESTGIEMRKQYCSSSVSKREIRLMDF